MPDSSERTWHQTLLRALLETFEVTGEVAECTMSALHLRELKAIASGKPLGSLNEDSDHA